MWNKLPDSFPEIDEFVLWRTEAGTFFVEAIDKDDKDWWNGVDSSGRHTLPRCTHWAKIHAPDEEPNQDVLWDEAINIICENLGEELPSLSSIEDCKKKYAITRK